MKTGVDRLLMGMHAPVTGPLRAWVELQQRLEAERVDHERLAALGFRRRYDGAVVAIEEAVSRKAR